MFYRIFIFALLSTLLLSAADKPNIIIILADDMGYGDVSSYNPDSMIQTPGIDRLAKEGIRFTDAHSAGTLCVQARYGLMTGRYPYRDQFRQPIADNRLTLAKLLKKNGYNTAMVGKWHLSFKDFNKNKWDRELKGGPVDQGFDSFFGIWASTDIPPYFYIKDRKAVSLPTDTIDSNNTEGWTKIQGKFWRKGGIAPGLKLEDVMPRFAKEAAAKIDELAPKSKAGTPFFLYYAFTGPHTPWLPTKEFTGKSKLGLYGDFVLQMDDCVKQVLDALDKHGITKNTMVIFSSDNGPVWYEHTDSKKYNHDSTGKFRGMKADAWEGGHRMPFLVRWPEKIKASTVSNQMICFTDMLKTFAALVGDTIPEGTTRDSWNVLPAFLGEELTKPIRPHLIVKTFIRQGDWKLIPHGGSRGFSRTYFQKNAKSQLYNLKDDPGETKNLYNQYPEKVAALSKLLNEVKK